MKIEDLPSSENIEQREYVQSPRRSRAPLPRSLLELAHGIGFAYGNRLSNLPASGLAGQAGYNAIGQPQPGGLMPAPSRFPRR